MKRLLVISLAIVMVLAAVSAFPSPASALSWDVRVLEYPAHVGKYTSIALDGSGSPILATPRAA